jgi:hypothetical protein
MVWPAMTNEINLDTHNELLGESNVRKTVHFDAFHLSTAENQQDSLRKICVHNRL